MQRTATPLTLGVASLNSRLLSSNLGYRIYSKDDTIRLNLKENVVMNILEFTLEHANRMWQGRTLVDNTRMIEKFNSLGDNCYKPVKSYKAKDIYAFIDYLAERGLSDATINRYTAALSSVFKLAVELDYLESAPKIRWKKEKGGRPRYFSDSEIQQLYHFFHRVIKEPWMAHFTRLSINTGMRLGEILSINSKTTKVKGEIVGNQVHLKNTKNGDDRIVFLNSPAKEALDALDGCPEKFYTQRRFYTFWNAARDHIAKGDQLFVFHVCRHTCATKLAMEHNVDTMLVGNILGHRSLTTTRKYVKNNPITLSSIMDRLSA